MNKRFKWTAMTLAAALTAYVLYAVAAVPLIEPAVQVSAPRTLPGRATRASSLAHLFPPGSWEVGRPKILDTEQGMLLFDDYEPLDDRRKMRLTRCTLVRFMAPEEPPTDAGSQDPAAAKGRPIILRALSGADLTFDEPLNIPRGEFGNLVSGQLNGEVTIYSPPSAPGADDAFELNTRNVQVDPRRIWTPHQVRFAFGPNSGSGRDLSIEWSQAEPSFISDGDAEPSLGSLKTLELVHLEKFEIHVPADDLFEPRRPAGALPGPDTRPSSLGASTTPVAPTPVEVTCRGPCRIDFRKQVAALTDHVRVSRHNNDGQSDHLLCELLEIHYGNETDDEQAARHESDGSHLPAFKPRRIVAVGYPIVIRMPSKGADARARRLEYDFRERSIWMEDEGKVRIQDGRHRVEAKELEYALGEAGRLGRLWARGPGHVWGSREGREFEATWTNEIRLRPYESNLVLSLQGGATANVADTGQFAADEVHVYFWEVPKPDHPQEFDLVPDRMKANGHVLVDSPQFTARVQAANLWFRPPDGPAGSTDVVTEPAAAGSQTSTELKPADPREKIDLVADVLHAQVIRSQPMQVERLNVQGGIRFQQARAEGQSPLVITGEVFELEHAHTKDAKGVLQGSPASVSARGMQMEGPKFLLHRGENTLSIDGAGSMTLPRQAAASADRAPFQVSWEGGMEFDGRNARFERHVSAQGTYQMRNSDVLDLVGSGENLDVTLTQYVDFGKASVQGDVDVLAFRFEGNVELNSQIFDPHGQRKLLQQMKVPNLAVNQTTGRMQADGPGWVRGVHRRDQLQMKDSPGGWLASEDSVLDFIRVDFANQMVGFLHQKQFEFGDHVTSIYGPVDRWDQTYEPNLPRGPNDRTVNLTCQALSVADVGAGAADLKSVVLEATGNAFVQGRMFSASGQRISYVRNKDQLILVGDGRNDAVLAYQPQPGAAPTDLKADKILYWPSTGLFDLDGVRSLDLRDLHQFGAGRSRQRR